MLFRNLYIFLTIFIIAFCVFYASKNLQIYTFKSNIKGPNILFLGGIHGNEESGSIALNRIVNLLEKKKIIPNKGSITIIPNINNPGLFFNSRYYSRISKDIDLNRLFGLNFLVNKQIEKLIPKIDFIVDFHEGWGFHKIHNSLGSTISSLNIKKKNIKKILINLNKDITLNYKKFTVIPPKLGTKNTLKYYIKNNFLRKKYLLVEITGQNNIQPLALRIKQALNVVRTVISIYNT